MEEVMKKIAIITLLISVALIASAADVTVVSVSGNVEIKEPGGGWAPVNSGQTVSSQSMISTGFGSRARLSVGGMELNLQPLTRVSIDSLTQEGETTRTSVSLRAGRVRATRPPATRSTRTAVDFRVSTPVATAAVRGTDFELSFNKLMTNEGLVGFSQGQAVVLSPGGTWSWAVEGLRPMNPSELVSNIWGVSPAAGSVPGGDGDSSGRSRATKNSGYAQISLQ
jgi:hypothetical protein